MNKLIIVGGTVIVLFEAFASGVNAAQNKPLDAIFAGIIALFWVGFVAISAVADANRKHHEVMHEMLDDLMQATEKSIARAEAEVKKRADAKRRTKPAADTLKSEKN